MASQALIKDFEDLIGKENVFTSEADRQSYSFDSAVLEPVVPAMVLRPTTTEQLGLCVKKLYDNGIPMTVRGAGTNLSGGTIPDHSDTVVVLTTGLNRILEINSNDLYAVVEPGVITADFAAAVAAQVHHPHVGLRSIGVDGLGKVRQRFASEGIAVDVADVAVPKLADGGGQYDGPPLYGERILRSAAEVGQSDLGARLPLQPGGEQFGALSRAGAPAFHSYDHIPGHQSGLLRRGIRIYPLEGKALRSETVGHADAHKGLIAHGAGKLPVFLRREVVGIGVAQRAQDLLQCGQI